MIHTDTAHFAPVYMPTNGPLEISVMGDFIFNYSGRPVATEAWQRAHARRLIQLLCSSPKLGASRVHVQNALWPGFDQPRACNRLHHTIHCIRKALVDIPLQSRPQIAVTSENIEFITTSETSIDVQSFLKGLDTDCSLADVRLACLQDSLALFRGELAPGWYGCPEIDARRSWLAKKRATALREAVDIAVELNRPKEALVHARHLAMLLEIDGPAHCQYAMLLMQTGRPDAALLHCSNILSTLRSESQQAAEQLEKTVLIIQKTSNQTNHANTSAATTDLPCVSVTPNLVSRQCMPAPEREPIGYESFVQNCIDQIEDPFCTYFTLLAPPGAGKSLLAATVGYRYQSSLKHGAIWIDCTRMQIPDDLFNAIAHEVEPLSGLLALSHDQLREILKNKELLIILDGLKPNPLTTSFIESIGISSREIKWIITSWKALYVQSERILYLNSISLTLTDNITNTSPAARIIKSRNPSLNSLQDSHSLQLIEEIAACLDGLPSALVVAAELLNSMSPNELAAQLKKDASLVMRFGTNLQHSPSSKLASAVQDWFSECTEEFRNKLAMLSRGKCWLSRDDIYQLINRDDEFSVDTFIHQCVSQQFLVRRIQEHGPMPKSEFRVAKLASAALLLGNSPIELSPYQQKFENWLLQDRTLDLDTAATTSCLWFDCHIEDLDSVVQQWIADGKLLKVVQLCTVHASLWAVERHCSVVLPWLYSLGSLMTEVESSAAPKLLLARAQFQIHMGQFNAACNDANHALTRQRETSSTTLTSQANQIIGRYGVFQERVHSNNPNLTQWGVEAGEALLRVGQLACRQGQLTRAFSLCSQSVNIFKFFDLRCGLMRSLYCCAKISLSMGNLNLAEHCIDQIEFYASKCRDSKMDFRVFRLRSDVYLANKQFGNAIALATEFIARPEIAVVNSMCFRAMAVIAWAHYGQGVISMAEAVCEYLLIETKKSKDLRLELSLKTLSALVFARTGRQNMASKAVYSAVDLIASKQPLGDTQTDLINIAELAHYLKRDDVAAAMLNLIDVFARNSDVEIRPWVKARVQILTKTMVGFKVDTGKKFLVMSAADIIKELAKDRDKTMRHSHLRYGESVVI